MKMKNVVKESQGRKQSQCLRQRCPAFYTDQTADHQPLETEVVHMIDQSQKGLCISLTVNEEVTSNNIIPPVRVTLDSGMCKMGATKSVLINTNVTSISWLEVLMVRSTFSRSHKPIRDTSCISLQEQANLMRSVDGRKPLEDDFHQLQQVGFRLAHQHQNPNNGPQVVECKLDNLTT